VEAPAAFDGSLVSECTSPLKTNCCFNGGDPPLKISRSSLGENDSVEDTGGKEGTFNANLCLFSSSRLGRGGGSGEIESE
jgi:hypothetical protein